MNTDVPESKLSKNEERFLSKLLAMFISLGYITVDTLYKIFPPLELFKRYEHEMIRRSAIFQLTKLGADYATEFDLSASANILEKGVKLGDVKLEDLYKVVSPDELVRVHDRKMLFLLMKDAKPFSIKDEKSCSLMVHAINDIITERLGSDNPEDQEGDREAGNGHKVHRFVVDAIGELTFMGDEVPAEARGRILKSGLDAGKAGFKFTPDMIFNAVPTVELVGYLPFEKLEPAIDAVALKFNWVEQPKQAFAVPKPNTDLLPAGALDSIAPPPPASEAESDEPELVFENEASSLEQLVKDDHDDELPVADEPVETPAKQSKGPPPYRRR